MPQRRPPKALPLRADASIPPTTASSLHCVAAVWGRPWWSRRRFFLQLIIYRRRRDTAIIRHVRHALLHYNARHPGDEYDAVKPLMASTATFKEQLWAHVNFWARSRKSNRIIRRFFAEVRYKHGNAVVEGCVVIEEPLGRYRKSCAFCPGSWDILHPAGGSRKFVLGNDKDRMVQRIERPRFSLCRRSFGMPFTCRPGTDSPRVQIQKKEEENI